LASGPSAADWAAAVSAVRAARAAGRTVLVCHVNPDGDALGSMLGFGLALRRFGVTEVTASFPGRYDLPEAFRWLPGLDLLVPADEAVGADLVISFDAASLERLGRLGDLLTSAPTSLVLDHHASNPGFGTINLVEAQAAATAVVVAKLVDRLGIDLDAEIAECLYVALSTDTGSFRYDGTTADVHDLAARLLRAGVPAGEVARRLFDSRPVGSVRLFADVLARIVLEPAVASGRGLVWTYATLDDLARHGQRWHVLEALIDSVRCVDEADVACVLKQAAPGAWTVSLRSRGATDVSRVAISLGGGGHRLAAGFTGFGQAADVIGAVRQQLD
jgi:phosphoesterase RecJ-like protein